MRRIRGGYASANHDTFPALEATALNGPAPRQPVRSSRRFFVRVGRRLAVSYHPSRRNKLVPGDMRIYEMPIARAIRTCFNNDPDRPMEHCAWNASAVRRPRRRGLPADHPGEPRPNWSAGTSRSAACSRQPQHEPSTPIAARFSIAIWCASVRRLRRCGRAGLYLHFPSSFVR